MLLNMVIWLWFILLVITIIRFIINRIKQLILNSAPIEHEKPSDNEKLFMDNKDFKNSEINKVLDLYELSGIKIPLDIIEVLHDNNLIEELQLYSFNDIYKFIENQRQYWKLENSKKPYK